MCVRRNIYRTNGLILLHKNNTGRRLSSLNVGDLHLSSTKLAQQYYRENTMCVLGLVGWGI